MTFLFRSRSRTGWLLLGSCCLSLYGNPVLATDNAPSELLARQASATPQSTQAFISATLDQSSVYVQAQAVLTVRVFHSIPLYDDSQFSALELPNARVELLGKTIIREQTLNGITYGVLERRYALFPQRSGHLSIPALQFNATVFNAETAGAYRGYPLQLNSTPLTLEVRPRPLNYPIGQPWLPAQQLYLAEEWNPESSSTVRVGSAITRTMRLHAEGLSAAQLPELNEALGLSSVRLYPEKPLLRDKPNEVGLTGEREESVALVPLQAGEIELPARELVWWNTREDRLERAHLPAHNITVEATRSADGKASYNAQTNAPLVWPWQVGCATLLLTNALTWRLWRRAKKRPTHHSRLPASAAGSNARSVLEGLRRACDNNDPHQARQALDLWVRYQPFTLADLASRYQALSVALDALNSALYSASAQQWQGTQLWEAISGLSDANGSINTEDGSQLPPLYPH